jgi:hypothetical protein
MTRNQQKLVYLAGFVVVLALLMLIAWKYAPRPTRVVTETKTVEVVKWQTKVVEVERKTVAISANEKVRVVERIIRLPDGTVTNERTTDRERSASTAVSSEGSKLSSADSSSFRTGQTTTITVTDERKWALSLIGETNLRDAVRLQFKPHLGAVVTRKIIGPLEAGVFGSTRGHVGVVATLRF